jgi:hypothetical protein
MPAAYCLVRSGPHYRADGFRSGLQKCGYEVRTTISRAPRSGDLLCIWNRYSSYEDRAEQFERAGCRVVVAENGYFGADAQGRRLYALSLGEHHHGGAPQTAASFDAEKWDMRPWRTDGDHILVVGQRGIGSKRMRSPQEWIDGTIADRLAVRTRRPVRFRRHPGKNAPAVPLADDLRGCHAVVVWHSAAGVEALLAGVPVLYAAPRWIAEKAAAPLEGADLENPFLGDRSAGLANAFANQWSIDEIASGEAFRCLGL